MLELVPSGKDDLESNRCQISCEGARALGRTILTCALRDMVGSTRPVAGTGSRSEICERGGGAAHGSSL